ncbi:DUF1149 family protein [Enterococcus avium]|uniref:DUF1149 family protein n=1 Tax=Enterococcus avium TaxID=33945 RepID=A0ABD5FE37_ENTAV|nr:DUF1149 family protein [Enterococcus avium]MDT2397146.1 DUF1149 family protein [Enterococcus avium]MDT2437580.1 DUF1149 family protein [Enterococcus avium]MDT2449229.1 DUF1149 family protein [Enterococcus avium]MDT2467875.1 DUF1149 family protein [Enterococcus avium]MDT2469829.1 DUF1149 family protein [Enterococcus avium]
MKIDRYKPKVNTFHYESKEDYEDYQNKFNIHITPLRISYPANQENSCTLGIRLDFTMVFEEFVVSGSLGQVSLFKNRKIESQEDLTKEELDQLLSPLFELVKRLTYEVSEIALDEPGVTIQFDQVNQQSVEVNGEEG